MRCLWQNVRPLPVRGFCNHKDCRLVDPRTMEVISQTNRKCPVQNLRLRIALPMRRFDTSSTSINRAPAQRLLFECFQHMVEHVQLRGEFGKASEEISQTSDEETIRLKNMSINLNVAVLSS